MLIKLVHIHM